MLVFFGVNMKDNNIYEFIKKETGIEISLLLRNRIISPTKLNTDNNEVIARLAVEFLPIYKHFQFSLDGASELNSIMSFAMLFLHRIDNKPELLKLYKDNI